MKKKLALKVEELRIEQFQVEPGAGETRGTVHGLASTAVYTAPCVYCPRLPDTTYYYDTQCC